MQISMTRTDPYWSTHPPVQWWRELVAMAVGMTEVDNLPHAKPRYAPTQAVG